MSKKEEWRPCFGGAYEVSNLGRVRRLIPGPGTYKGRPLRTFIGTTGYVRTVLCVGGRPKNANVHALVAEAFLGRCPPRQCVNHKNGIKADPRAENLEYRTPAGNMAHAVEIGLMPSQRGSTNYCAKLTEDGVRAIRARRAAGESVADLATSFRVSTGAVYDILRRRNWSHVR